MGTLCGGGGAALWYFAIRDARRDYHPLREGSKWEYDFELQMVDLIPLPVQKGAAIQRIEGTEKINGKEYFKSVTVTSGIPGMDAEVEYLRKDATGIYELSKKNINLGEQLVIPEPPEIGKEWTMQNKLGEFRCRIEGKEDVHLGEKVYRDCLKIRRTSLKNGVNGTIDDYFAPNIGQVKSIVNFRGHGGGLAGTLTLRKHTP